ncbi:MAG: hypothetical protein U0T56_12435 [Ferruginibacter sp.]
MQVWKKLLIIDEDGNEMLPNRNRSFDYFKKGETIRAVVKKVELKNNQAVIILSRAVLHSSRNCWRSGNCLKYLTASSWLRSSRSGEKGQSGREGFHDDRIHYVGIACVGMKGSRIHGIVRELKNENIDVINWTNNIQLLIQRSLTPAKITSMELDNEKKHANVYLKPDQVSLAIGRRGVNIKLACELTGFDIDVFRDNEGEEEEFDIDLDEFTDEIEPWVIDELKRVGCDTARSVLDLTPEELERRTDLEKETITEVRRVLQEEFDRE